VVFRAVSPVPQVRVTDAAGNAVAGVPVTFTASIGSTVVGASKTTDANGLAGPDGWVLGNAVGNYTLTAAVSGVPNLAITASARADAASAMTAVAGNNQTAQAGRAVAIEPSVRVADQHGNPVAGIDVLFEVGTGGGTAVGRRATTNAVGVATVGGWTLGDAVGSNTLVASVATSGVSVSPVTFTATATAGAAASMTATAGQNQTASAGSAVTAAPAVLVRDARGNPVGGVAVSFAVGSGNGTVTGASTTTNTSGVATVGSWVLGSSVGTQTLVARSGPLPEVTFTATATAGAAARLAAWSSQNQVNIVAGSSLTVSQRPAVRVTDLEGNPVTGVVVTFRVAQSGASGYLGGNDTVSTATTNSNGIATVAAWVVPATAGVTATASASVTGVADAVDFQVATIPGAVARLVITSGGSSTLAATAGTGYPITLTARDANNNVVTAYSGSKSLVFSGAGVSATSVAPTVGAVAMGNATSATFSNGVASLTMVLYKAETASVSATDGTYSSGAGTLSAIVTATTTASAATSTVTVGSSTVARNGTTTVDVTVKDVYGNVITTAAATSFVASVSAGTAAAGTLGAFTCTSGVCSATYTAPNAGGTNTLAVTITASAILNSPITITMP
jgi:adhesin/invasin